MATKAILGAECDDDDALDFLANMTLSIRKRWTKTKWTKIIVILLLIKDTIFINIIKLNYRNLTLNSFLYSQKYTTHRFK